MKTFRAAAFGVGILGLGVGTIIACSGDDDDAIANPKPDAAAPAPTTTGTAVTDSSPPAADGDVPDATLPPDSCDGYQYCENFEAYDGTVTNAQALGPWAASVSGVTMAVDTTRPHSGARSLHITTIADGGAPAHGTLRQTPDGGLIPGNDVYGRVMIFYNDAPGFQLPLGVHSWIFNTQGNSIQADGGVDLNMGGGGAKMQLNYHFPNETPAEQAVVGGNITTGAWHCIQWQFNGSKDGGKAKPVDEDRVWLDGTLAVDAVEFEDGGGKKWPSAEPWKLFDFGFNHYQVLDGGANQPNYNVDVYLDDFAMSNAMVPCPQ